MSKNDLQAFSTSVQKEGSFIFVAIPFSPRTIWGAKPRYYVTGTINGNAVQGCLGVLGQDYFLRLSKAWIQKNAINLGEKVTVRLEPDQNK